MQTLEEIKDRPKKLEQAVDLIDRYALRVGELLRSDKHSKIVHDAAFSLLTILVQLLACLLRSFSRSDLRVVLADAVTQALGETPEFDQLCDDLKRAADALFQDVGLQGYVDLKLAEKQRRITLIKEWLCHSLDDSNGELDIRREERKGTKLWVDDLDSFQSWLSNGGKLWIHGGPGVGKSVLSAYAFDKLLKRECADAAVLTFFASWRNERLRSVPSLIRTLSAQLLLHEDSLGDSERVLSMLESLKNKSSVKLNDHRPENAAILLRRLVLDPARDTKTDLIILLDGLDELMHDHEPALDAILESLVKNLDCSLLVTSRPSVGKSKHLESQAVTAYSIQPGSNYVDLEEYLQRRLKSDTALQKAFSRLEVDLFEILVRRADGNFRWLVVVANILSSAADKGRPISRQLVDKLPDELSALYTFAIAQIDKEDLGMALIVIAIVLAVTATHAVKFPFLGVTVKVTTSDISTIIQSVVSSSVDSDIDRFIRINCCAFIQRIGGDSTLR